MYTHVVGYHFIYFKPDLFVALVFMACFLKTYYSFLNVIDTSYIGLIRLNRPSEARQFWYKWENEHIHTFPDEMRAVSMVSIPEQLTSEEFLSTNHFM